MSVAQSSALHSIYLTGCTTIRQNVCQKVCQNIRQKVCRSVYITVYLSHLSIHYLELIFILSVSAAPLSVTLSVTLFLTGLTKHRRLLTFVREADHVDAFVSKYVIYFMNDLTTEICNWLYKQCLFYTHYNLFDNKENILQFAPRIKLTNVTTTIHHLSLKKWN